MLDKESVWIESYRQQRLQEAEHQRLVHEVLASSKSDAPAYQRMILWFGNYLILWGVALHNRYGEMPILRLDRSYRRFTSEQG
jgi:hypothetical protein